MSKSFVEELEERGKLFEENIKKLTLQENFFEEGLIGDYKRLAYEHRKTNKVKKYKKIKIYRRQFK
ncbi:MAG: hypothetical protein IKT44_02730 [Clostridia bacterium]|nr:hypothetical protein [Clostridia bacterium]